MKVLLIDQIAKVNYKYSYSLANAVVESGVLIEAAIDQKTEEEHAKFVRYSLFNTSEKTIGKIKKLGNYLSSFHKVLEMLRGGDYDVVHMQWIIFSPLDYYFIKKIKKTGVRLILTVHDILPFNQKFYDYRFYRRIYSRADEIIVQTRANAERFRQAFPDDRHELHVIPHGHFLDYVTVVDRQSARQQLGFDRDAFIYLFFGQIKKVKGVEVLLEAYAKLLEEHSDLKGKVCLAIAGNVWKTDFGKCQEIIDRNRLRKHVRLDIRYIPDEKVGLYYGSADVCVLPYLDVYQSGVLQLTYAHRRAAIATRIPAFEEIVDESNGFLCEKGNADALKDQLYAAYQQRAKLPDMGESGYRLIKEKYSWDEIAKKITEIYRNSRSENK